MLETGEIGHVTLVGSGVATVRGVTELRPGELIAFADGHAGLASSLSEREVGAVLLGLAGALGVGAQARRAGRPWITRPAAVEPGP